MGLRVVSSGVDTVRYSPEKRSLALRAGWGVQPDTLVALCVGRLAPEKNLGAVLTATEAMHEALPAPAGRAPRRRLVLVGDGPERTRLQQRSPETIFAGQRHGEDLAAHCASADVFLFASTTETFGNVVPEAMASGLAVVAYDHAAAGQLYAMATTACWHAMTTRQSSAAWHVASPVIGRWCVPWVSRRGKRP